MKIIQIIQSERPMTITVLTNTGRVFFGELNPQNSDEETLEYDWREVLPPSGCEGTKDSSGSP